MGSGKKWERLSFLERENLANWIRKGLASSTDFLRKMTDQETAEQYTKETGHMATGEQVQNTRQLVGIFKHKRTVRKHTSGAEVGHAGLATHHRCATCGREIHLAWTLHEIKEPEREIFAKQGDIH